MAWTVPASDLDARATPTPSTRPSTIPVMGVSPGFLRAARPPIAAGWGFDPFHNDRAERVAVLGSAAAAQLGVNRIDHQPAVFIHDRAYTVIGILQSVERDPDLLLAVLIPHSTARLDVGSDTLGGVLGTALGILTVVAVAASREWTTTLDATFVLPAPLLGALTGLVAGLYPSLKAARTQPATALRSA